MRGTNEGAAIRRLDRQLKRLRKPKTEAKCLFELAWIGKCGVEGCKEHANLKCHFCGSIATHQCAHAGSVFVCGRNLCGSCSCGHG